MPASSVRPTSGPARERGIDPYIAPGREAHRQTLADLLAPAPVPPPEGASPRVQMAYKLRTPEGPSDLSGTQTHRRAGDWDHQGGAGLPAVLAAGGAGRGRGVVPGVSGLQPQAAARPAGWRAAQCGAGTGGPVRSTRRDRRAAGPVPDAAGCWALAARPSVLPPASCSRPTLVSTPYAADDHCLLSRLSDRLLDGASCCDPAGGGGGDRPAIIALALDAYREYATLLGEQFWNGYSRNIAEVLGNPPYLVSSSLPSRTARS